MTYSIILSALSESAIEETKKIISFCICNNLSPDDALPMIFYDECSCQKAMEMSSLLNTEEITLVSMKRQSAETILDFLVDELKDRSLILFPDNHFGREISVRLAYRVNAGSMNSILSLHLSEKEATVTKNIYSGNLLGTYSIKSERFIFTIDRSIKEAKDPFSGKSSLPVIFRNELPAPDMDESFSIEPFSEKNTIKESATLIIMGRGVGNKEHAERIIQIGKELGIPVLGSRPVTMNGWINSNLLAGVSGYMLSPRIAIVVGASGASAFYAGISNSSYIISVNNDESAPIVKGSDFSVIGDCNEILSLFYQMLIKDKNNNEI